MAKVILDLPPELERGLEQIVQNTGRTRNAVVYEALEAYMARQDNTVSDHSLPSPTSIINNDSSRTEDDARLHADDARSQAEAIRRGRPVFRSLGVGENTELNGENSEDWLRENWPKHFLEKRSASSPPLLVRSVIRMGAMRTTNQGCSPVSIYRNTRSRASRGSFRTQK